MAKKKPRPKAGEKQAATEPSLRVVKLLEQVEALPEIDRVRFDMEYCARHSDLFEQQVAHHDNAMSQLEEKIWGKDDVQLLRMKREGKTWRKIAEALTDENDGDMQQRMNQVRQKYRRAKKRAGSPIVTITTPRS
jgi:hypothetical protein